MRTAQSDCAFRVIRVRNPDQFRVVDGSRSIFVSDTPNQPDVGNFIGANGSDLIGFGELNLVSGEQHLYERARVFVNLIANGTSYLLGFGGGCGRQDQRVIDLPGRRVPEILDAPRTVDFRLYSSPDRIDPKSRWARHYEIARYSNPRSLSINHLIQLLSHDSQLLEGGEGISGDDSSNKYLKNIFQNWRLIGAAILGWFLMSWGWLNARTERRVNLGLAAWLIGLGVWMYSGNALTLIWLNSL
jgi:hypothetical protein